jgi:copper transport protein
LFVHVVSIAFWIGALPPLLSLMISKSRDCNQALERFSRFIPLPLAALVASGVVLAVFQVGQVNALWLTNYGRILSLKLAIVLGLFGLAAFNRLVLTPAWRREAPRARARFTSTVTAELILATLTFATVALWRFTPPPRTLAAASDQPVFTHIHTEKAMADVTVARSQSGLSRISIVLQTGNFQPLPAKEVTFAVSNPSAGIEPISRSATASADRGTWRIEDFMIPAQGYWNVNIEVLISDFEKLELAGEIEIRR